MLCNLRNDTMREYLYTAKNLKGEFIKGKYQCNSYQELK